MQNAAQNHGLLQRSQIGNFLIPGSNCDPTDSEEGVPEELNERNVERLHEGMNDHGTDTSSGADFADRDESLNEDSENLAYERTLESHRMGPPPRPAQRRSAPSPYPPDNLLQASMSNESLGAGSLRLRKEENQYGVDVFSDDDNDDDNSESTIKSASGRQDSLVRDVSPKLAAFEQRAGSPTSPSTYERNHVNPNYTDLSEPLVPYPAERRLEEMRARNAKENHHDRIPPQDAPPHMQMMVLLYQWIAWALEVSDQKRREKLVSWVNERFMDFMLSGGHVPGYNLRQLLDIAGVDPKELYGYTSESSQQGNAMVDMSSSQLAATINGAQVYEAGTEFEDAGVGVSGGDADDSKGTLYATHRDLQSTNVHNSVAQSDGDGDDDGEEGEIDDIIRGPTSISSKDAFKNHDPESRAAATAVASESPSAGTTDRKREASSEVDESDQVFFNFYYL